MQGAQVVACDPAGLGDWVRHGLGDYSGAGVDVLTTDERPAPHRRRPVAVRRFAGVRSFDGWRVTSDRAARIVVYASCFAGGRAVEATFDVRIQADEILRVTTAPTGTWRLEGPARSFEAPVVQAPLTTARPAGELPAAQRSDCNR